LLHKLQFLPYAYLVVNLEYFHVLDGHIFFTSLSKVRACVDLYLTMQILHVLLRRGTT